MKKSALIILFAAVILSTVLPCMAIDVTDPILRDEENEAVFRCGEDIFIEIKDAPTLGKSVSSRNAVDNYLHFSIQLLYLSNDVWAGIDKNSFHLAHIDPEQNEEDYPLNFAVSMITNRMKKYNTFGDMLEVPSYRTIYLVFDVTGNDKNGWSLVFSPAERGKTEPVCSVTVPLTVK